MARKVYFAFHYQDVIDFRANVVRKYNMLKGVEEAGYYDYSIWEEAKKKGALALKRMINGELNGTTFTTVLIGSQTYARRWVRYEIIKSLECGNYLLGIHINGIKGKDQMTKARGPNPFDYVGIEISQDGKRANATEWDGNKWVYFSDLPEAFAINEQPLSERGQHRQLSYWYRNYDWVSDNGFNNFISWLP